MKLENPFHSLRPIEPDAFCAVMGNTNSVFVDGLNCHLGAAAFQQNYVTRRKVCFHWSSLIHFIAKIVAYGYVRKSGMVASEARRGESVIFGRCPWRSRELSVYRTRGSSG